MKICSLSRGIPPSPFWKSGFWRGILTMAFALMAGAASADANCFWSCRKLDSDGRSFSWTLTTRIGDMLHEAEQLFGERDKSWTILGCQYCRDDMQPENWHPGYPRRKDIVFNLSAKANVDMDIALFQLSHEVVHALAPKVGTKVNVLEEGVAAWFSAHYVKKATGKDATKWMSGKYRHAYDAVSRLLDSDPAAIRKLRGIEPCFKNMTPDTFAKAGCSLPNNEIVILLRSF